MMKKTTTATTSRKKADSQTNLSAPVSQRVELDSIRLLETIARQKPPQGALPTRVSIDVSVQTDADKKQGVIQVRPRFVLVAQFDDASGDEPLRIEALFLLRYRVPSFEGLRKANIDAFGQMNGLYNVWPFWREFIQATTVRMGLPALTIPVYRPVAIEVSSKKASSRRTSPSKRAREKRTASAAKR